MPQTSTDAPGEPVLWHLESKVLGGFYQSDVIVMARSHAEAVDAACAAFNDHIDQQIADLYFSPAGGEHLDPDDEDYAQRREYVLDRFRKEAIERISRVAGNRLVRCSS